jgi:hypothetical protein
LRPSELELQAPNIRQARKLLTQNVRWINAVRSLTFMLDLVQFTLEIVAVFIGAFAAFEFDNFGERQNEKRESVRVLELLKRELEINLHDMIPAIRKNLQEMKMPFTPLELDIWEAISNKIDRISNDDALEAIARAYYRLHALEKVANGYRTLAIAYSFAADTKMSNSVLNRLKRNENIILEQIREPKDEHDQTLIQIIREAITETENEIHRLGSRKDQLAT